MSFDSIIIGGDSFIGSHLFESLRSNSKKCIRTSRECKDGFLQIDVNSPNIKNFLPDANTVYYCAAINGFDMCDRNPSLSALTNVISTLNIARKYISDGSQFIFLSSSSVFGNCKNSPTEQSIFNPNTLYGFTKMSAEIGLKSLAHEFTKDVTIIRLTKVLSPKSSIVKSFIQKLNSDKRVETISNLFFSPISIDYACKAILLMGEGGKIGTFHLSGEEVISQTSFAKKIAAHIAKPISLIYEKYVDQNANFHQCNHLSMARTTELTNLKPQSTNALLNDLLLYKNHLCE